MTRFGVGYIDAKGYRRARGLGGRRRMVHDWIWEQANGPIPDGMQIHHRNGIRDDNRLENLELVDPLTHKRIHSPHYRLVDGITWERKCKDCEEWKPAYPEYWYFNKQGWINDGRCRPCQIRHVGELRKARKARNAA